MLLCVICMIDLANEREAIYQTVITKQGSCLSPLGSTQRTLYSRVVRNGMPSR